MEYSLPKCKNEGYPLLYNFIFNANSALDFGLTSLETKHVGDAQGRVLYIKFYVGFVISEDVIYIYVM